jgi:hypothetical protein
VAIATTLASERADAPTTKSAAVETWSGSPVGPAGGASKGSYDKRRWFIVVFLYAVHRLKRAFDCGDIRCSGQTYRRDGARFPERRTAKTERWRRAGIYEESLTCPSVLRDVHVRMVPKRRDGTDD